MSAKPSEEEPEVLPSGLRKGKLPKFEPTEDELEEGIKSVEHLFDDIDTRASTDDGDSGDDDPPAYGTVKYMVMRADGTLIDVAPTARKKAFDTEAFGDAVAGFFDGIGEDEQEAADESHGIPVVHLRSNGILELQHSVFAELLRHRIAGLDRIEACAAVEELLKDVQVLPSDREHAFEVFDVEGSVLTGVYPDAERSVADGSSLLGIKTAKHTTRRFLKDGQKFDLEDAEILILDVLGKFLVRQQNTMSTRPEPSVAGIAVDDRQVTLLEGLFKNKIIRSTLQEKRILGVGLAGRVALLFSELDRNSNICDRKGLKKLVEILEPVVSASSD